MEKKRKTDQGENMLVHGIEQDQAAVDEVYARLSPQDRGELSLWLTGRKGDLRNAPDWIINAVLLYASLTFMQAGWRWATTREVSR